MTRPTVQTTLFRLFIVVAVGAAHLAAHPVIAACSGSASVCGG